MALSSYPPNPYAIGVATLISFMESDVAPRNDLTEAQEFVENLLCTDSWRGTTHANTIDASATTKTLSDLLHHKSLAEIPEIGFWLQTATQSFDAFIDLMASLSTTKSTHAKSTADVFRRNLVLQYERLSLTEVVVLYNSFCRQTKEAISNTKSETHGSSRANSTAAAPTFESVLECLAKRDRVGSVDQLHQTMDHSLYALSAAGDLQELIFSTFGESTIAARREGIRAAQKQGEHAQKENEATQSSAAIQEPSPTTINHEDPELAMLQALVQNGATSPQLADRHMAARKQLMGRFRSGKVLYQEALKCMIGSDGVDTVPFEFIGFFLHEWAVRRRDWGMADAWMSALECHLHPRLDPSIFADHISQKALSLSRQGKWKPAVELIERYLEQQQREETLGEAIWDRMCLQLGQILLDAQHYTAAQATLLRCRVSPASLSLLAILHLEFYGDTEKARGFATAACPNIMLKEHVFLQGQVLLTMARCTGTISMYERSLECFHAIQDVTALCKAYQYLANEYQNRNETKLHEVIVARIKEIEELPLNSMPLPGSDEMLRFIDEYRYSTLGLNQIDRKLPTL